MKRRTLAKARLILVACLIAPLCAAAFLVAAEGARVENRASATSLDLLWIICNDDGNGFPENCSDDAPTASA